MIWPLTPIRLLERAPYYPIFLDLCSRKVVVIGGGPVAERKVKTLLEAGARVIVVAPQATAALQRWDAGKKVRWLARKYRASDLNGAILVFSATDRPEIERQVAAAAARRGIAVNCAGKPESGSFLVPARAQRGRLQIAVSTGGASPVLACRLAQQLQQQIGPEYAEWTRLLARLRPRIVKSVPLENRPRLLEQLSSDKFLRLLRHGRKHEASQAAERLMQRWEIKTGHRRSNKKAARRS
ncbi:MAG: bifunctional precorrin-2 dehydrogenase/sirohydrochlorin ferrochelatase [Acidobacteria bacterium]|nr:bifunctional precorrin-2 dehydrogenase/sirohydrochlorin ferrochelatase [Acidobacteriota bacterium]